MKEAKGEKMNRFGMFLGAAAYGFTHAPIIAVKEIKKELKRRENEKIKRDALKGILMMRKYINEMHDSGEMDDEKYIDIMVTSLTEYIKLFE